MNNTQKPEEEPKGETKVNTNAEVTIEAKVKRADGTEEDLGVVSKKREKVDFDKLSRNN